MKLDSKSKSMSRWTWCSPCTWLNGSNFQDLMNSVDLMDLAKFNSSTKLFNDAMTSMARWWQLIQGLGFGAELPRHGELQWLDGLASQWNSLTLAPGGCSSCRTWTSVPNFNGLTQWNFGLDNQFNASMSSLTVTINCWNSMPVNPRNPGRYGIQFRLRWWWAWVWSGGGLKFLW